LAGAQVASALDGAIVSDATAKHSAHQFAFILTLSLVKLIHFMFYFR
jgi:hypothetical protein